MAPSTHGGSRGVTKYRPDIDGLRAVAVVPVVLYHARLSFTGGYVGVDVFFVISGYLITNLVLKEIARNQFELVRFWERRVLRLFPALFVVVMASLIVGGVTSLQHDFESIADSARAQALLIANVHFWRDSGYFAGAAETKPLLHTWSLAVEEQFYLFFPLLLALVWRNARRWIPWLVWLVLIGSLALSIYGTYRHPLATFYLLPMRAWELMLGALLAIHRFAPPKRRMTNEVLAWAGLAAIIGPCLVYTSDTRFPGAAALVPCLGTAVIIYVNRDALTSLGRLLALRPVVFIGLISYSLYLWHWPILVFGNQIFFEGMTVGLKAAFIAAGFIIAVLSWRFIETPFRKRHVFTTRRSIFAFGIGGTVATLAVATIVIETGGLPQRLSADVLRIGRPDPNLWARREMNLSDLASGNLNRLGDVGTDTPTERLVLWGDSHAMAVVNVLDVLAEEHGVSGYAATRSATTPILGTWRPTVDQYAVEYNQAVLQFIRTHDIEHVIMVSRWIENVDGLPDGSWRTLITDKDAIAPTPSTAREVFERRLGETVRALVREDVHVWILRQVAVQEFHVPRAMATCAMIGRDGSSLGRRAAEHQERREWVDGILDSLRGPNVTILDPDPYLFLDSGRSALIENGDPVYRDNEHLSETGSLRLRPMFETVFDSMTKTSSATRQFEITWIKSPHVAVELTKTEVTVGQYAKCVETGVCTPSARGVGCPTPWDHPNMPVRCVGFDQAESFCRWVGGVLPLDRDWLLVATHGGRRTYPWGERTPDCRSVVMVDHGEDEPACGRDRTWPVCSKPSGNTDDDICDLVGNVAEWAVDRPELRGGSGAQDWVGLRSSLTKVPAAPFRADRDGSAWIGFRCSR